MVTLMWAGDICWVCTVTPRGSSFTAVCRPCCITTGISGVGTAVTWAVAVSVPVLTAAFARQTLDTSNSKYAVNDNAMIHRVFFAVGVSCV